MIPDFKTLDDFKSDRQDVTPPLPQVFRLVPVLFFATTVGCIFLIALFLLQTRILASSRDAWLGQERDFKKQLQDVQTARSALEGKAKRASDLSTWVDSTRPMQPMLVNMCRSFSKDSAINEISLARVADDPKQLRFTLKFTSPLPSQQLDLVLAVLADNNYRNYSPEQRLSRGAMDFASTLVRQVLTPLPDFEPGEITDSDNSIAPSPPASAPSSP